MSRGQIIFGFIMAVPFAVLAWLLFGPAIRRRRFARPDAGRIAGRRCRCPRSEAGRRGATRRAPPRRHGYRHRPNSYCSRSRMFLLIVYVLVALVFSFLCSIAEAVLLSVRLEVPEGPPALLAAGAATPARSGRCHTPRYHRHRDPPPMRTGVSACPPPGLRRPRWRCRCGRG